MGGGGGSELGLHTKKRGGGESSCLNFKKPSYTRGVKRVPPGSAPDYRAGVWALVFWFGFPP